MNELPKKADEGLNKDILENTVLALLKSAPGLGSVQINKGLILIDAVYHSFFKKTLTGINYIKHWYGPVPDNEAHSILYRMEFDKIKVIQEKSGNVFKSAHYAITNPDYSLFSSKAIEIIRDISLIIFQKKARKLSEITHDLIYENTPMGGIIPIDSVYSIECETCPWTEKEKADAQSVIEEIEKNEEFDLSPFYAQD